jgi:uncharacterized protein YrzB (UPF0473 family)
MTMSDEFGANYLTIEDENGDTFELEVLDTFEVAGQEYMAALPADMEETDPDYGMIILHALTDEHGEDVFEDVEDEEELQAVYEAFMNFLFADEDEEEE